MVWETRATWKNDPADTRQCSCLNVLHSHSCAFEMLKDACFVLYTQAFISEMLLRQQPKKKKKSLWKVEAINIISFEEPVSASLRECPMTVSEASGGEESVLKSSVEITTRKSCWSKHSEVWGCGGGGWMLCCVKKTARDQHWRFCEVYTLTEPEGSAHAAD